MFVVFVANIVEYFYLKKVFEIIYRLFFFLYDFVIFKDVYVCCGTPSECLPLMMPNAAGCSDLRLQNGDAFC